MTTFWDYQFYRTALKFFTRLMLINLAFGLYLNVYAQQSKTQLLIVGSDHLAAIYKEGNANTDVLTLERQKQITEFTSLIKQYTPDMIMVEMLPDRQQELDSLYRLYRKKKLDLNKFEDGRSEVYQLAFRIGNEAKVGQIVCVNAPGGTSQGILDNGQNIELYKGETSELRKVVGAKYAGIQNGTLSFKDFLISLNQPAIYNLIYHLRYITPARVTNGTFKNPDKMVDTAFIDRKYIGAELTSIFKNRDYKIYSNIVSVHLKSKPKKMLLIIGVAHIGSLTSIFRDDSEFELVDAKSFLNR